MLNPANGNFYFIKLIKNKHFLFILLFKLIIIKFSTQL